jgi:hypothetical protein
VTTPVFEEIQGVLGLLKGLPECSCYRCKKERGANLELISRPSSSDFDGSQGQEPLPVRDARPVPEDRPALDYQDSPPPKKNQNKNI